MKAKMKAPPDTVLSYTLITLMARLAFDPIRGPLIEPETGKFRPPEKDEIRWVADYARGLRMKTAHLETWCREARQRAREGQKP